MNPANWASAASLAYKAGKAMYDKYNSRMTAAKSNLKPKSGTKLKTRTKTKSKSAYPQFDKSNSSYSYSRPNTLASKVITKLSPVNVLEGAYPNRLQATSGTQAGNTYFLFDSSPLAVMLQQINIVSNNTKKLFLDGAYACIEYANASAAPIRMSLYDLYYKVDMNAGVATVNMDPWTCWNQSEIDEGDPAGAGNIMSYPTKHAKFSKYYGIAKKTDLTLLPGEVHTHKVYIKLNTFVKQFETADYQRLKRCTSVIMCVAHGTPVDNTGATDVSGASLDASGAPIFTSALTQVSTSPVAINQIMKVRYQYRWINDDDTDTTVVSNVQPLATSEIKNFLGSTINADTS